MLYLYVGKVVFIITDPLIMAIQCSFSAICKYLFLKVFLFFFTNKPLILSAFSFLFEKDNLLIVMCSIFMINCGSSKYSIRDKTHLESIDVICLAQTDVMELYCACIVYVYWGWDGENNTSV